MLRLSPKSANSASEEDTCNDVTRVMIFSKLFQVLVWNRIPGQRALPAPGSHSGPSASSAARHRAGRVSKHVSGTAGPLLCCPWWEGGKRLTSYPPRTLLTRPLSPPRGLPADLPAELKVSEQRPRWPFAQRETRFTGHLAKATHTLREVSFLHKMVPLRPQTH